MEIEQIDRDAAARIYHSQRNHDMASWISHGKVDADWIVQLFACHRHAAPDDSAVERAFLAVMNARDRELSLPLTSFAERNLLKRRIAVAIRAVFGE